MEIVNHVCTVSRRVRELYSRILIEKDKSTYFVTIIIIFKNSLTDLKSDINIWVDDKYYQQIISIVYWIGNWQSSVGIVTEWIAKENIVSTLWVLHGVSDTLAKVAMKV